ncbi:MAG TPA: response regulator [Bacteroidota bacterium]|nr:response regulator [Bacteroidota bacterium]
MPAQPKVLYIDDEKTSLDVLKFGLEDKGYAVSTFLSGQEALDHLSKDEIPDVIIADLRMSPMNGFELYEQVKKNNKFINIPFFFLTGMDDHLAQKYGQTLGVDAYVTKPVDLDNLDAIIRRKISKK